MGNRFFWFFLALVCGFGILQANAWQAAHPLATMTELAWVGVGEIACVTGFIAGFIGAFQGSNDA